MASHARPPNSDSKGFAGTKTCNPGQLITDIEQGSACSSPRRNAPFLKKPFERPVMTVSLQQTTFSATTETNGYPLLFEELLFQPLPNRLFRRQFHAR